MKCMIIFVLNEGETFFWNITVFTFFYNMCFLTVCDSDLSHSGKADGCVASVKQEHEEVSGTAFCELIFC